MLVLDNPSKTFYEIISLRKFSYKYEEYWNWEAWRSNSISWPLNGFPKRSTYFMDVYFGWILTTGHILSNSLKGNYISHNQTYIFPSYIIKWTKGSWSNNKSAGHAATHILIEANVAIDNQLEAFSLWEASRPSTASYHVHSPSNIMEVLPLTNHNESNEILPWGNYYSSREESARKSINPSRNMYLIK